MNTRMREQFSRMQRSLRGPAWRSMSAQELANQSRRTSARMYDPLTIDMAKFYALRAEGADGNRRAAQKYPDLAEAISLQADGAKTDVMKLLILVDARPTAIAKRVGVEPAVVDAWERLFFDVRDLRSAVGWMSGQVIDAECQGGNTALAARMKLALTAGTDGVNAILALDEGVPVDEAERLFQRKLELHLKFDEAVNMPIHTERSRRRFVKLYVDLRCSEQRLELAEKKLAARCAAARDHFELAKMRLKSIQERAKTKAKELRKRAEQHDKAEQRRSRPADRVAATDRQERQRHARLAESKGAVCRVA